MALYKCIYYYYYYSHGNSDKQYLTSNPAGTNPYEITLRMTNNNRNIHPWARPHFGYFETPEIRLACHTTVKEQVILTEMTKRPVISIQPLLLLLLLYTALA